MTDEYGTLWTTDTAAMASTVQVGNHSEQNVLFVPYRDRRLEEVDLDGTLGMSFFSRFHVTANWHQKKLWIRPRSPDVMASSAERIRRWGSLFDACNSPGCVSVQVVQTPIASVPSTQPDDPTIPSSAPGAEPSFLLRVEREARARQLDYDVLLEAVGEDGRSLGLPRLLVTLPRGVAEVTAPDIDPNYGAAAAFTVIDVGPFPADHGEGGCAWQMPIR
jgi:hypothetical protein